MTIISELFTIGLLLGLSFIAVVPMLRLVQLRHIKRYKNLRYFSYVIVLWTLFTLLRFLSDQTVTLYYTQLLTYPIILLVIIFGVKTIYTFLNKQLPRFIEIGLFLFFLFIFTISITNELHYWMLELSINDVSDRESLLHASVSWAFTVNVCHFYYGNLCCQLFCYKHL